MSATSACGLNFFCSLTLSCVGSLGFGGAPAVSIAAYACDWAGSTTITNLSATDPCGWTLAAYEPPSVGPVCDTRPVSFAPPLGWGTGASPKNFFIASSSRDRLYEGFLNDEAYRLYSSRVREPGSSCARCWSLAIACAAARLSPR